MMGITIVQKIRLHVFIEIPLFLIPRPDAAFSALRPFPIFSSILPLSDELHFFLKNLLKIL